MTVSWLKIKEWLFAGIFVFAATAVLLFLLEFGVRIVRPDINAQDTERKLFRGDAFGHSAGWVPSSRGMSFGVDVFIDGSGFRQITPPLSPIEPHKTWLFLGDSVTFGVGVAEDQIFPQLIQNDISDVRVVNSGVVGYSMPNYRDVVAHALQRYRDLDRVILFFTLNDTYGNLELAPRDVGIINSALSFLRKNSRLYVLAKNLVSDRSKAYFLYDYATYAEGRDEWTQTMDILADIAQMLRRRGIAFDVVLLPYEYQLRMGGGELLRPQQMILRSLNHKKIIAIDLYGDFAKQGRDSRDFFLYGDPMHLSAFGHRVVYSAVVSRIAH